MKYRSKRTTVDGITFHSKKEASRYSDLKLMQKAGAIANLELQVKFPIIVRGMKICTYIADFAYNQDGHHVIEDVKGPITPVYRIKKKLIKAIYKIDILET